MKSLADQIKENVLGITIESLLDADFDITDNDVNPLLGVKSIGTWQSNRSVQIDYDAFHKMWLVGLNKKNAQKYGLVPTSWQATRWNRKDFPIVIAWDKNNVTIKIILRGGYSLAGDIATRLDPRGLAADAGAFNCIIFSKNKTAYLTGSSVESTGRNGVIYYSIPEDLFSVILKNINLSYKKL